MPGRKTDWHDAQWRQQLQARGLLQASFRPAAELGVLRTLLRPRAPVIAPRAPQILHLQNPLKRLHMPWRQVLPEITG